MKNSRSERLGGEFQKEIYAVISGKLRNKHPELSAIISVTYADVAPDLKSAKIFVSIYDTNEEKKLNSFNILKQNAAFIRRELAQVMHLRTVPELRFILDGSLEYGSKIDKILTDLHLEKEDEE